MMRALVNLGDVGRVAPMPFLGDGKRPIAWVEIGGDGEVAIHGKPSGMRELAAAATMAADQADEMLRGRISIAGYGSPAAAARRFGPSRSRRRAPARRSAGATLEERAPAGGPLA
jgi:hypothetical protein